MQKMLFFRLFLALGVIGVASCSSNSYDEVIIDDVYAGDEQDLSVSSSRTEGRVYNGQYMTVDNSQFLSNSPDESAKVFNKRLPPLNSLIVCRDRQCAPSDLSRSKEYIFSALAQLIDNNLDQTALLCEANPQAHVCMNPYLTVPAKIGVTPAYVYMDGVKLVDASIVDGKPAIKLALNYNISYNGQTPTVCKPDTAVLYVKNNRDVVLNGNGFKCEMTSLGTTTIRVLFNVDYIDLDYGYIGGYYSIGLSGPAVGGGSGYGLIRLIENAFPLNPILTGEVSSEKSSKIDEKKQETLKPLVKDVSLDVSEKREGVVPVEVKLQEDVDIKEVDNYSESEQMEEENSAYPNGFTQDSVVSADKLVLRPKATDLRPIEVHSNDFDEVGVEDLDDYIK